MSHLPVLCDAVLESLLPEDRAVERVIDGTLGAGGHTRALLDTGAQQVLGLDLDLDALELARRNLTEYGNRVYFAHASYTQMPAEAMKIGWQQVDGILLDLGVSSMQLDTASRGFSFLRDGALDMRFDPAGKRSAASDLVNHLDADGLSDLFFRYGEERHARRLAKGIVQGRPYQTTLQLADVIAQAMSRQRKPANRRKSIHPATRVFQALRIAVNDELQAVETVLPIAINLLKPGARLAVISFHSLEDRIVKQAFKAASTEITAPPGMASIGNQKAQVRLIRRKPIVATAEEISQNPRSRSAKLRVVEKL